MNTTKKAPAKKSPPLKVGDRIGIATHDPAAVKRCWADYLTANGLDPADHKLPTRGGR